MYLDTELERTVSSPWKAENKLTLERGSAETLTEEQGDSRKSFITAHRSQLCHYPCVDHLSRLSFLQLVESWWVASAATKRGG